MLTVQHNMIDFIDAKGVLLMVSRSSADLHEIAAVNVVLIGIGA